MTTEREKLIERAREIAALVPTSEAGEVLTALADIAALRTPPPVVDREPQLGDGPDYHADRLAWAIRQRHYVRMVDRTLTTADVRQVFLDAHPCRFDHDCPAGAEFDRWLGEHAAQVLEEAASFAASARDYVGGADSQGSLFVYKQPRFPQEGAALASELRRRAREYREGTR